MSQSSSAASRMRWGLPLPLIIYLGSSGLEGQVLQGYMTSIGYAVRLLSSGEETLSAMEANPGAIVVVALDRKQRELIQVAERLRAQSSRPPGRVFVLSTQDNTEPAAEGIEIVPRPYRLSELVRRIQMLGQERPSHA